MRGGYFADRAEAEAYHNTMHGYCRMHARIVGCDDLPDAPHPGEDEDQEVLYLQEEQQYLEALSRRKMSIASICKKSVNLIKNGTREK